MSHTHEDRVAERDPCMCVAYGCPLMGTMTGSTSGANDWSCALHVNRSAVELQTITVAINRHRWLAQAITDIRTFVPGRAGKAELMQRIRHDFEQAGRADLCWNGVESARRWVNRLDAAFEELVLPELLAAPKQEQTKLPNQGFQRAADAIQWA